MGATIGGVLVAIRELDPKDAKWLVSSMKKDRIELNIPINWQTPDEYLDAARELMGGIDIDPASSERAQERIRAKVYYTKDTNGLDKPWLGRLWLNSPYDTHVLEQFCKKAISEYRLGNVIEGLILTHTSNTHFDYFQDLMEACSAVCFIRGVIKWVMGHEQEQQAIDRIGLQWHAEYTEHSNAVLYLGVRPYNFKKVFAKFGVCLCQMKS